MLQIQTFKWKFHNISGDITFGGFFLECFLMKLAIMIDVICNPVTYLPCSIYVAIWPSSIFLYQISSSQPYVLHVPIFRLASAVCHFICIFRFTQCSRLDLRRDLMSSLTKKVCCVSNPCSSSCSSSCVCHSKTVRCRNNGRSFVCNSRRVSS